MEVNNEIEWHEPMLEVSGARYEGQINIKSQEKEGFGIQIAREESIYEGQWKSNKYHGIGRMISGGGKYIYEGQYENGKPQGKGILK